jgi:hypothetical protein
MSVSTPFVNTAEIVERTILHNLRVHLVAKNYLPDITLYTNDISGTTGYNNAMAAIRRDKGFCIEVFGVASPHARDLKRIPRIVVIPDQALPGDIGGNPDRIYAGKGPDSTAPEGFTALVLPPQTTHFIYDIHVAWNEARQKRVLEQIVGLALPKRGYIPLYVDPVTFAESKMFIRQISHRNIESEQDGIGESIYTYEVPDIFETSPETVATGIAPINEITVEHTPDSSEKSQPLTSFKVNT